jgi:predicted esterase
MKALMVAALFFGSTHAVAADPSTVEQSTSVAERFPPRQVASLSRTLGAERRIVFRVRMPPGDGPHGVLVFVGPRDDAEPREEWPAVLEQRDLIWISAEGFGNDKPSAQRVLVALMALKHLQRTVALDRGRIYVGGLSGGGRIASQALVRFPGFFSGALCIVGADFIVPEPQLVPELADKRVVFVTGDGDFNRREMHSVYTRFIDAGVTRSHLLDLPDFGHEYPDGTDFDAALGLLDRR